MTISNVLICDDNASRVALWESRVHEALGDEVSVQSLTGTELAEFVGALYAREQQIRGIADNPSGSEVEMLARADRADVIILDSDLSPSPHDLALLNNDTERMRVSQILRNGYGDTIARQLRSYTTVGLIVVVNMFWSKHLNRQVFDLTMVQEAATFADLHVSENELGNASFWRRDRGKKCVYNPWNRPAALEALDVVRRSEAAVQDINAPLLEALQLDPTKLLRSQQDLFEGHLATEITFNDLCSTRLGFRYQDGPDDSSAKHTAEARQRMAASVTRRWLQRVVVPPQNVLSDAPHLHSRLWRLFGESANDIEVWDSLAPLSWKEAGSIQASPALHLPVEPFMDRPVFEVGRALERAKEIDSTVKSSEVLEVVFAEDSSRFIGLQDAEPFISDIPGPYGRRYIESIAGVGYEPAPRLLL